MRLRACGICQLGRFRLFRLITPVNESVFDCHVQHPGQSFIRDIVKNEFPNKQYMNALKRSQYVTHGVISKSIFCTITGRCSVILLSFRPVLRGVKTKYNAEMYTFRIKTISGK
ncbi:hypothetical protein F2P81_007786 [Scophthalmus maximus]|uniref:Uncharacterized protein n=1 Tax=Scophthalmus maximus TaxID=52904 RepID=A0A6A4T911_SCOMX|nr:hypothetical protein F2P81_007786 [Scophthalmus maximus]